MPTLSELNVKIKVDLRDLHKMQGFTWVVSSHGYAAGWGKVDGKRKHVYLHRIITGAQKGLVVDHINHDKLDNRRENLRVVTAKLNTQNRQNSTHKYQGVYPTRQGHFNVKIGGSSLGTYYTEEDAALVYDEAARRVYGEGAKLNIPDQKWTPKLSPATTSKLGYKGVEKNGKEGYCARFKREYLGTFKCVKYAHSVWRERYWEDLWSNRLHRARS